MLVYFLMVRITTWGVIAMASVSQLPWTDKELKNKPRMRRVKPVEIQIKDLPPMHPMQMTAEMKSHSNVARLYEVPPPIKVRKLIFPFYIQGRHSI